VNTRVAVALAVVLLLVAGGVVYSFLPGLMQAAPTTSPSSPTGTTSSSSTSSQPGLSTTTGHPSSSTTVGASSPDWPTYHKDLTRTGVLQSPVASSVRQDWTSPLLDGDIYAEPLFVGGNVYVATENNSVYSLNAQTGSIVWRTNLGTAVNASTLPCGDISPVTGITGTPVINVTSRTLYAVAFLRNTEAGAALSPVHHVLFSLNIDTGMVLSQVGADAAGSNPVVEQERSALSLSDGIVYVPYGGLAGDCGQYWGFIVGSAKNGTVYTYKVPAGREGGFWATSGLGIDSFGNVYAASGNGASFGATFDHGDAVIKLSPALKEIGFFAPTNWSQLNADDTDIGSLGPTLLNDNTLFQIGKEGVGYLVSAKSMGGIGAPLFSAQVCREAFGGTAYANSLVYVPCRQDGLFALQISGSSFTTAWHTAAFNAGPPIIAGGLVWTVDLDSSMIHAYNQGSGTEAYHASLGPVPHFTSPTAGGSRVYVVSGHAITSFLFG